MSVGAIIRMGRILIFSILWVMASFQGNALSLTDAEVEKLEPFLKELTTGERIALWAEKFVGVPYDEDPKGIYVTQARIVVDEKVDCMYLTFRAVELGLSRTPEEAIRIALDKRFRYRGELCSDGTVANYEDRFQYGEDMVESGKWGREITARMGSTARLQGARGRDFWEILPPQELLSGIGRLKSGDLVFFMTPPEKRKVGEGVGHIGVVKVEDTSTARKVYLIHASGTKLRGGSVRKILLTDYVSKMPFVGVKITRFE